MYVYYYLNSVEMMYLYFYSKDAQNTDDVQDDFV